MDDGSYVDKQKTQCIEYAALKKLNKDVMAVVLDQFKEDVFGGQEQIGPCLAKIEEQIKAKYEIIKKQFLRKFEKQL